MNNYEFIDLFIERYWLYIACLLISISVYIVVYKGYVKTIFDPLFISLTYSSFGSAIVLFLFATHSIPFSIFLNFLLTQVAFSIGLFCFRGSEQLNIQLPRHTPRNLKQINSCYFFFGCVTIICHLITYKTRGIPLFLPSRLEAFSGGSGIGIIARFIDTTLLSSILCYYYLLAFNKEIRITVLHHLLFATIVLFLILSGSKSAFLNLIFCLFCLTRFYPTVKERIKRVFPISILQNKWLLGLTGLASALIIITLEENETPLNPIQELGLRFISSGDTYYMAYPNGVYKLIDGAHGFKALFLDFLGFFRIYSWNELPEAIGIELAQYHHWGDIVWGPNARHNLFGLIYYGFAGSIIFSFVIGAVVAFFRNKMLTLSGNNIFFFLLYSMAYIKVTFMETDPMLALTYLNNILIIFPILFVLFLMYYEAKTFNSLQQSQTKSPVLP